jgi:glycosyltransferase involved in cell wall biosynthesis
MALVMEAATRPPAPAVGRGRLRRVLYAANLDPRKFGTMEEQAFLLASAFRARGGVFLPVFTAPSEPVGLGRYRDAGLAVEALDLRRFRAGALARLLGLISTNRIEVVHWNFFPPLTNPYLWALAALAPRVQHYFTDHNSRCQPAAGAPARAGVWKKPFLKRYERVFGVSGYVVDRLREQGVWPQPAACMHFINTDRFAPDPVARAAVRRRLDAEGRFVLVATAYLIRAKGIDVAVRALASLPEAVVLWVIGDGDQAGALRDLARDLGVASRVRFLGLQSQVEPYMQAADCFVCPSLWAEAAGLVNLEAQACGLPVVASRIGGIPEYVAEGRSGYLFAPGDPAALASAVRRLLDEPETCRATSRQARELAVERFSAAARIDEYVDLYRRQG